MLQPVTIVPSAVSSAAPTLKFEGRDGSRARRAAPTRSRGALPRPMRPDPPIHAPGGAALNRSAILEASIESGAAIVLDEGAAIVARHLPCPNEHVRHHGEACNSARSVHLPIGVAREPLAFVQCRTS
jgi:hypothetical protein